MFIFTYLFIYKYVFRWMEIKQFRQVRNLQFYKDEKIRVQKMFSFFSKNELDAGTFMHNIIDKT